MIYAQVLGREGDFVAYISVAHLFAGVFGIQCFICGLEDEGGGGGIGGSRSEPFP